MHRSRRQDRRPVARPHWQSGVLCNQHDLLWSRCYRARGRWSPCVPSMKCAGFSCKSGQSAVNISQIATAASVTLYEYFPDVEPLERPP
jgi:hypothetical protein